MGFFKQIKKSLRQKGFQPGDSARGPMGRSDFSQRRFGKMPVRMNPPRRSGPGFGIGALMARPDLQPMPPQMPGQMPPAPPMNPYQGMRVPQQGQVPMDPSGRFQMGFGNMVPDENMMQQIRQQMQQQQPMPKAPMPRAPMGRGRDDFMSIQQRNTDMRPRFAGGEEVLGGGGRTLSGIDRAIAAGMGSAAGMSDNEPRMEDRGPSGQAFSIASDINNLMKEYEMVVRNIPLAETVQEKQMIEMRAQRIADQICLSAWRRSERRLFARRPNDF
jgi:hypothetical protein